MFLSGLCLTPPPLLRHQARVRSEILLLVPVGRAKLQVELNTSSAHLAQNPRIVAFHDIRPAAVGHLLVIPRSHCTSVNTVHPCDLELGVFHSQPPKLLLGLMPIHTGARVPACGALRTTTQKSTPHCSHTLPLPRYTAAVQEMREIGEQLLSELYPHNPRRRLGYHVPPWTSVNHLQ